MKSAFAVRRPGKPECEADGGVFQGVSGEAACMAMGQVAGEAAALASKKGCSPLELPLDELRRRLRDSGAIVPEIPQ